MNCDVGKATEGLGNELWRRLENELCSFSNLSVTSPTSQLILKLFRRFTYVTARSPTLPLLHLRHSSFSNPSFASPTSQALQLRYPASHHGIIKFYGDEALLIVMYFKNILRLFQASDEKLEAAEKVCQEKYQVTDGKYPSSS